MSLSKNKLNTANKFEIIKGCLTVSNNTNILIAPGMHRLELQVELLSNKDTLIIGEN